MWSISLPPEHHRYFGDYFTHFGALFLKHKYYTLVVLIIIAAVALALIMQNSAAGSRKAMSEVNTTATNVDIQKTSQNPAGTQASSTPDQALISNSGTTKTEVKVNDQAIAVPTNGSIGKTVTSNDGNTHVDVSINSTTTGSSQTSSSTSFQLNTNSRTESSVTENSE